MAENREYLDQGSFSIFIASSMVWLLIGEVLTYFMQETWNDKILASKWVFGLWALSSLDLWVLAKTVHSSLNWMGSSEQKQSNYSMRTLYWSLFKLICLGFLVICLLKAHSAPMSSLLLGVGTLLVVPLVGGVIWNQRLFDQRSFKRSFKDA